MARAAGAIAFAVVIGLLMYGIFRKGETQRNERLPRLPGPPPNPRRLWQTVLFFAGMVLFLVFSDWYNTNEVTISLKDGTRIEANIRYSQPDALEVQEYDAAGRMMGDVGRRGNYFVAAIFFIVGLHLLGVIPVT